MTLPRAEIVAAHHSNRTPIEVMYYPAGEPYIKDIPADTDRLIVRPKSMDALMAALFLMDARKIKHLCLPYFPGARQDRINQEGDMLFTARSVARILNDLTVSVSILDPHSDVVPALLNDCRVYGAHHAIAADAYFLAPNYVGVIAPDAGSVRRATKVAELMQVKEVLQGWKHRDTDTGKITGFGLAPSQLVRTGQRPHYLVVDDICDGGGTFIGLAAEIERAGLTADLYVTHGIFSQGTRELLKHYEKIFTTDSIVGREGGTTVIEAVERME